MFLVSVCNSFHNITNLTLKDDPPPCKTFTIPHMPLQIKVTSQLNIIWFPSFPALSPPIHPTERKPSACFLPVQTQQTAPLTRNRHSTTSATVNEHAQGQFISVPHGGARNERCMDHIEGCNNSRGLGILHVQVGAAD